MTPNVRHERRHKDGEASFGTSARWRGYVPASLLICLPTRRQGDPRYLLLVGNREWRLRNLSVREPPRRYTHELWQRRQIPEQRRSALGAEVALLVVILRGMVKDIRGRL